ncbi:uncharacterized protein [Diadema setosum]|uniref:uncharacterized protein n=1 Tax=Diadema setosum TaxID=31175 RepID=UPI003B3B0805
MATVMPERVENRAACEWAEVVAGGGNNNRPAPPATKDTVINLGQHHLSDTERNGLSLGLNFAVAPKKVPFSEIIQQVEPKLRFLTKAAADNIRLKVAQALSDAKPPKPNITKEERAAIKDLRHNKTIHILQAYKDNATVVMDKQDYDKKIQDLIDDPKTYSKLKRDPTPAA